MSGYFVGGMHRSGTSLLSHLLEAAGAHLGPPQLLHGGAPDNPRGFAENVEFVALNDALLASIGASWFDVLPVIDTGFEDLNRAEFFRRSRRVLARAIVDQPWLLKDPRLALTLEPWRDAVANRTGPPARLAVPFRHPAEVALSLFRRDETPLPVGAALWEAYHVQLSRAAANLPLSENLPTSLVSHQTLLANPMGGLERMLDQFKDSRLTVPPMDLVDSIVDPALYRSSTPSELADSFLTSTQKELFAELEKANSLRDLGHIELSAPAREVLERFSSNRRAPVPFKTPERGSNPQQRRKRVAVVVQGCRLPVFAESLSAISETWASIEHPDVDVFTTYGNGCDDHDLTDLEHLASRPLPPVPDGEVRRHGNLLLTGCSDLVAHQTDSLLRKRLLSLRYLLDRDNHDAILLVCASSYIDQEVLAEYVQTMPTDHAFIGPTFVAEATGRALVSGSAMMLSRDLAERLVADTPALITSAGFNYADDVAISDWVAQHLSANTPDQIVARLHAGRSATDDNTFNQPPSLMLDYGPIESAGHKQVPGSYHYHFATDKPEAMRAFHRRWYAQDEQIIGPPTAQAQPAEPTIFVHIASYRDADLPRTITSALATATAPQRLRFGICWQYDERTFDDLDPWLDDPRFSVDEVYYRHSRGCTWARARAGALFNDETYYLQLDAHMRFEPDWDTKLIAMLEGLKVTAEKPVLSVYPPGFTTDGAGNDTFPERGPIQVLGLERINENLQTRQCTTVADDQTKPGKSPLLAAGLLFAPGSFCREIPYDPEGYFNGEEIALAARAYTSGYDFFYPSENLVWHRYDHGEPLHWTDHDKAMTHAERRAKNRLGQLLLGEHESLGKYSLGSVRTLAEFETYAGIDFAAAARGQALLEPEIRRLDIDVDLDGIPEADYDLFVFAILGEDERELLRCDIDDPKVLSFASRNVVVEAEFDIEPSKYLLWPRFRDGSFGDRRIRTI